MYDTLSSNSTVKHKGADGTNALVACSTHIVNITVEHTRLRHHTNIHAAMHEATRDRSPTMPH